MPYIHIQNYFAGVVYTLYTLSEEKKEYEVYKKDRNK